MKKLMKILLWIAGIVVALFVLLVIGVKLFLPADKIKAMAIEKGSAALGREIQVAGLDISIWGGLGVELQQVSVGNPAGFQTSPFLTAEKIDLKLQLLPLIFGDVKFDRLVIDKPNVNMVKTAAGAVNYAFATADTLNLPEDAKAIPPEGQSAAMAISFGELEIKNGLVAYRDDSSNVTMDAVGLDLVSSLEYPREGVYQSAGRLQVDTVRLAMDKPYPSLALDVNYRVSYELPTHTLALESITAGINAMRLKLSGQISGLPDMKSARMNVSSDQIDIANVLSLLSPEQRAKLADYTIGGKFSLDVDLTLDTSKEEAAWVYGGNVALTDVKMSGKKFPGELALSRCLLDLKPNQIRLNIEDGSFDKQPLKGYLTVDDFAAPRISGELSGSLDLAVATPFLPTGKGHELSGRSKFDLKFSGPVKKIDSLSFSGDLTVTGGKYNSKLMPEPIQDFNLDAYFDRRVVNIRNLDCSFPSGKLAIKGRVTDLVPYFLADSTSPVKVKPQVDADIKGTVDLAMVKRYLPPKGNPQLSGQLVVDVNAAGLLSDLTSFRPRGQVEIQNASYNDSLLPEPIRRFDAQLVLKPDTIDVRKLEVQFTSSDVAMTGQLTRPFPYFLPVLGLNRDSLPKPLFVFELSSHRFDTDKLFPEAVPGAGEAGMTISADSVSPMILPDIEGRGTARADTVIYCKVELSQVTGKIRIKDRKIECYEANAKVYTGTVTGNTTIDLSDFEHPQYTGEFAATQVEANDFVSRFSKFSGFVFGKTDFTGNFNAVGWEPADFLKSLTLDGKANIHDGKVVTSGAILSSFTDLASKLGKSFDKEQALKNLVSQVIVKEGRVYLGDLATSLGQLGDMGLGGSYGFDGTLEYAGTLKTSANVTDQMGGLGKLLGGGQGDAKRVNLPFKVTGTITAPKLTFDYTALGKAAGENLLNQAVDKLLKK
jgi:ribosomal protein L31